MQFSHNLSSKVFIYALLCPLSNQIRYIGKSKNPQSRLRNHLKEVKRQDWKVSPNHRQAWIYGLLSQGFKPTLLILEEVDETKWQSKEMYWISYYKKLGLPLVNSTDGGDGGLNPSEQTRQRQSYQKKGKRLSDTHRKNMSRAQFERYQNPEELEKARAVLAEIRQRDSVKHKQIAATTERWKNENFRKTTSAAISRSKQKYVYFVKTSDGNVEKVLNLRNWCQTNGYNLQSLQQVARGDRPSCHGITITRHLLRIIPRKPEISAAQTYFAVKTREAEIGSNFDSEVLIATVTTAIEQVLTPINQRLGQIENHLLALPPVKPKRPWTLSASTPLEEVPEDYKQLGDGSWLSPEAYESILQQSRRSLFWELRQLRSFK